LEQVLKAYQNRSLQSAEVIARLVELARELWAVEHRGQALGLTEEEMAFYDAVAKGQEHITGDEQLKTIARELVAAIKKNLNIDWTDHENVKAKIRATVKRLLQPCGYKPAKCETRCSVTDLMALQLLASDRPGVYGWRRSTAPWSS